MQKRKTAQKPKPTNGTRKRQVHKPRSDAKLQARSDKTALARISFFPPKGKAGLEISPDDSILGSPAAPRGVHDPGKIPPWHTGTFCRFLPRWWWSKSWAQWNILEWAWPGRDEKSQSERGGGEVWEWAWDLGGEAVGIPSWAAGFIRILEQAWRCALVSSVLFVFVAVARGCRGPSNLYHVLIILGNGQGPAGWGRMGFPDG